VSQFTSGRLLRLLLLAVAATMTAALILDVASIVRKELRGHEARPAYAYRQPLETATP